MKKILITGGTGSWGKILLERLLLKPTVEEVRIFSRNEYNQVMMARKYTDPRVKYIIGDIRDYEAVFNVCRDIDTVFHLAALKHVPICEEMPLEAIKTNIAGTECLIRACVSWGIQNVIDVSTDKACSPNTLYGATKLVGEKLILNANNYGKTKFRCIRAGNVLGSAGSVVPLFIDQIKQYNSITVTDCAMTRYFMSLHEAIELIIQAVEFKEDAEMLVMRMPSCTIGDLANAVIYKYGDAYTTIREVGIRANEKRHELLINADEAMNTYVYNTHYYAISNKELKLPKVTFKEYGSNTQRLMTGIEILDILTKGGF
jgi:UDP-N-acetylglucosamine 4,6-dehydratase/5-epimerase